jgi:hypothetical protein
LVWATVSDRRGHAKSRPLIILTATNDIRPDEPLIAMAVTTTVSDPPPADHVLLPWHPQGRVMTRLRRRSAAVLSWIVEVEPAEITDFYGDVPARLMTEILKSIDLDS